MKVDKQIAAVPYVWRDGKYVQLTDQELYFPLELLRFGWLASACRLGGKAVVVAVALSQIAVLTKSPTVRMRKWAMEQCGIGVRAYRNGLQLLEAAGLVSVERNTGQKPQVTLLNYRRERSDRFFERLQAEEKEDL